MSNQILQKWLFYVGLFFISITITNCGNADPTPEPTAISESIVASTPVATATIELFPNPQFGQVKVRNAIVREFPDTSSHEVERLPVGSIRLVTARQGDWVRLARNSDLGTIGWTLTDFLILTAELPTKEPTPTIPEATVTDSAVTTEPIAAETPTPCGAVPQGWTTYYVQSGDTLSNLSVRGGVTVADIKLANCLPSDMIMIGSPLFLPSMVILATNTSVVFVPPTPTDTATGARLPTDTQLPATSTPIEPPTPTDTATGTRLPTYTPLPATSTPIEPPTPTGTETSGPLLTNTPSPITETPIEPVPPTDTPDIVATVTTEAPPQPLGTIELPVRPIRTIEPPMDPALPTETPAKP